MRSFYHPNGYPISLVAISNLAHVVFYSHEDSVIHQCHSSSNSRAMVTTNARETLHCMIISKDAECLIAGGTNKTVFIYRLHRYGQKSRNTNLTVNLIFLSLKCSLELIHKIPVSATVTCLAFSVPDERYIFAGLDDGHLLVLGLDHISPAVLESQKSLEIFQ